MNVKLVICVVGLLQCTRVFSEKDESDSHCYSRFDYESKMLERIVMVEHRMNVLQESTKQNLEDIKTAKDDMLKEIKEVIKHLRAEHYEKQHQMSNELKLLMEEVRNATNEKLVELTDVGNNLQVTSNSLVEEQKAKHAQIEHDINNMTDVLKDDLLKKQEEITNNLTTLATTLEAMNNATLDQVSNATNDMKALSEKLKDEQALKLETVEIIGNDIKVEIQEKMLKLEAADRLQKQTYESTLEEFKQTVDTTWADIKAEGLGIKPPVVFNVVDVSASSWYSDQVLPFVNELVNTDSVYDTSSGYFITTVNGTYMFSAQVCGYTIKHTDFRIVLNDKTVLADAAMFDYDSDNTCTSTTAVALLNKGDTVCVKAGPNNLNVQSVDGKRSAFMGALVH